MFRMSQGGHEIRFEPDEKCPPLRAIASALQIFLPNTISLVMLAALVVQASGESVAYLSWMTFTVLAVTGASMVLQTLRLRHFGSGCLIVANFNVPFLAVSALALLVGGPSLLASLIVVSTLVQSLLTLHLATLRRIFTPTVSGRGGNAGGSFRHAFHHQQGYDSARRVKVPCFSWRRGRPPWRQGFFCPLKTVRCGVYGPCR